jgi:hypothetical protein
VEGCEAMAKPGSIHCRAHAQSALGRAAKRQLRDLLRELERLATITDPALRRRAEIRFGRKLESGRYALLFSKDLQELEDERRRNASLETELGGLRVGLCRALLEIEDPSKMAKAIAHLKAASCRVMELRR